MLAIRSYRPGDGGATIGIFLCAIREVASRDYTPAQIAAWAQVPCRDAWARKRASRPTWVATVDGEPAGFSDLEPGGHLDMLYVHPRSQRIGVASLLLQTVEAAAGAEAVSCLTTEASLTARSFFERRDFAIVRRQEVQRRGQVLPNLRMRKALV